MKKSELPLPLYNLAFLQAYLYQIFSLEGTCKKNFEHTEWYLKEKYSEAEVESIVGYFKSKGLKCDCDVIHKLDLREIMDGQLKFHN
jgi:hypothetical protein